MHSTEIAGKIKRTLESSGGILFAEPTIVYRNTYSGRGLLADNTSFSSPAADSRGYLPVERWVMSACEAANPTPESGEGLSEVVLNDGTRCAFRDAVGRCADVLLAEFPPSAWPLVKVLDIGGEPVSPDFHDGMEAPPIPPHIHPGPIVNGRPLKPGKLEAYFFPPTDLPPYNCRPDSVVTRLGLRPGVKQEEVLEAIRLFGRSDALYSLLTAYPIRPREGWLIPPGVVHSPGPWVTIEIQTPQDDYNLLAWQLGSRLSEPELSLKLADSALRGLPDAEALLGAIDWTSSTAPDFRDRYRRLPELAEEGGWGRRHRVFFDPFDGDLLELEPGSTYSLPARGRPAAALVWSGSGTANGLRVESGLERGSEFFLAPERGLALQNGGASPLALFLFYPMAASRA